MWTILFGPFLAFLPRPWRESLPFARCVQWGWAAVLSGSAEFVGAIVALSYWYMYTMSAWVNRGVDSALRGKMGPGITTHQIAGVALSVWATHPLTWLFGYFIFEGAVRLCGAAFSDSILGTLPLFLLDKILFGAFRRRRPDDFDSTGNFSGNVSSFFGAIRERMLVANLRQVHDELFFRTNGSEQILEIRACRRKQDWNPPRVVRVDDRYYRLLNSSRGSGRRPFRYTLRRLAAGVPGRTVLLYSPADALIRK
ncbi:MAG TPA: hypothetical protein VOA41_09310 [Candidatus Dormibacteraeota bacterium]|nr:hypothetical protein [Candidatus Dormibacteraeota bacterium]